MDSEWPTATVEEVSEKVAMGPFGSNIKVETFVPHGIPVISGQHLRGFRLDETSGFNFVTEAHADKLGNSNVRRGDVIFTHAGNIGQVAYVPTDSAYDRYVLSQRQFYMRCDKGRVIPEYVTYYFKSREGQHSLLANSTSVGVPSIARPATYLRSIVIPVPPLDVQRAIASTLGALDDKIELNRKMSRTLDEMARAMFKSWFVDFDRSVEFDESSGLPVGWKSSTVDEVFDLTMGQSPPGSTYNEECDGLPFYQGRADFGSRYPKRRVYCTAPTRLAKTGDALVSVRAPVGDVNVANEQCAVGRGVAAVRHKRGYTSFTYHSMRAMEPQFKVFDGEGTVFGSINKKNFGSLTVVNPGDTVLQAFESLAGPLDERVLVCHQEEATLAHIRDALLPRLLSGALRVSDAEEAVERVV